MPVGVPHHPRPPPRRTLNQTLRRQDETSKIMRLQLKLWMAPRCDVGVVVAAG